MDRRTFLRTTLVGAMTAGVVVKAVASERYFPSKVDKSLFDGINRVKDPAKKTSLEKGHGPFITAPASIKAGEPFSVEVTVGENLHPMGASHWIEYIELSIGNEPAGRIEFQSRGFLKPRAIFTVVIPADTAPEGKVTLVARELCNLHGLWEGGFDITVH